MLSSFPFEGALNEGNTIHRSWPGRVCASTLAVCLTVPVLAADPSLTVSDVELRPGQTGIAVVRGQIDGDATFGVTVLLEIVPRPGATGTVTFTPAPPEDIVLLGDPWSGAGTFTAFDTDLSGSPLLNGAVLDNGTFVPKPVTFDGPLAGFPITVSIDASGVWDLTLSTSAGESGWEGLSTTTVDGTITVSGADTVPVASEWGLMILALLLLSAGGIAIGSRRAGPCHRKSLDASDAQA